MGFLNRKIRAPEPPRTGAEARIVHREIEITVHREWIAAPDPLRPAAAAEPEILPPPRLPLPPAPGLD